MVATRKERVLGCPAQRPFDRVLPTDFGVSVLEVRTEAIRFISGPVHCSLTAEFSIEGLIKWTNIYTDETMRVLRAPSLPLAKAEC